MCSCADLELILLDLHQREVELSCRLKNTAEACYESLWKHPIHVFRAAHVMIDSF